jgi:hypothetical protein
MWRALFDAAGLFVSPFVVYVAWLLLRRRYLRHVDHWTGKRLSSLVLAGLFLAVLGMILLGLFDERKQGAFIPPREENGKFLPGHIE